MPGAGRAPRGEFCRVLAEIPHVSLVVLRVVVERLLCQRPADIHQIVDHDGSDTEQHPGLVQDAHDIPDWLALLGSFVDEGRAGREREVWVVDSIPLAVLVLEAAHPGGLWRVGEWICGCRGRGGGGGDTN